jgi:hypothetical protein
LRESSAVESSMREIGLGWRARFCRCWCGDHGCGPVGPTCLWASGAPGLQNCSTCSGRTGWLSSGAPCAPARR